MRGVTELDSLWDTSSQQLSPTSDPWKRESLSDLAIAYLSHAIADGTPLALSVRLEMRGEIKVKTWMPFEATQIIHLNRGFVWRAKVKKGLGFISGFDQYIDGVGQMTWKLFGLIPVMTGAGPDISRSARDRFAIEHVLLPSALCDPRFEWTNQGSRLSFETPKTPQVTLDLDPRGRVCSVSMLRWGNPDGGEFGLFPFGGYVDDETSWNGYTIPSSLRLGWHFGTDRFQEGEFFRATITKAEFR